MSTDDNHTAILSPPLTWGDKEFRDRHLTGEADEKDLFDPRCPKCIAEWAQGKKVKLIDATKERK